MMAAPAAEDSALGPFTVHLVGKDGGVKLRREGPASLDERFAAIDAMPMGREERRQRSGGAVDAE